MASIFFGKSFNDTIFVLYESSMQVIGYSNV